MLGVASLGEGDGVRSVAKGDVAEVVDGGDPRCGAVAEDSLRASSPAAYPLVGEKSARMIHPPAPMNVKR